MDSEIMDDSEFNNFNDDDDSDAFVPEVVKPKAKAAAKKATAAKPAGPKKMVQSKLPGVKAAPKKRAKPESDLDDEDDIASTLSQTPPSLKKQKTDPPLKKSSGKVLAEIENDSMQLDSAPALPKGKKKTATETYQKLTQLEHIIKRPDTYIGSVERTTQQMWVFNKEAEEMEKREVSFVPGLYKIFDEILVNAADNKQRDNSMTYLKVTVNREEGEITVENNGRAIPVEMHEKEKVYIPELIFGHLLAGSNFDDDEKKTVGGRNGYGAKLCNVFSTQFTIEIQDSAHGKRYKQTWTNNMTKMEKAKITSNKSADFVRVSFKPDFQRFGMPDGIDDDLEALMIRRVYDMAGTVRGVKVSLNGTILKVDFKKYCTMYSKAIAKERDGELGEGEDQPTAATVQFEDTNAHERWEIGFTVSDGSFQQVSFVNSIATTSGGTHVNYIADQICNALLATLNKKRKGHTLKMNHIRNHIFVFINCFIENPAFNSQTKEQLTTKPSAFGSKCVLTDNFIKRIRSTKALEDIMNFAERKADQMMAKSDGTRRSRISNDKLVDANLAGTKHGHECTLILTEGDSARGLAVAGRAVLDPDRIGVFPLRGKLLNVRDASIDQITKNKEIQNIKQFLGLKHKQVYTDTKSLRYGHLMIMADQDHDGSHIKGLLINFLQVQFPSLLQIPDFFREFITPVVKVWQGRNPKKPDRALSFFSMPQYEAWKEAHKHELKKWESKYLKGLGSNSNEDAQIYFKDLDAHLKEFEVMKPEEAELFDLAFSKKKADARKEWLGKFVPGTHIDSSTKVISYSDFINKELILFSMADNLRSIPSVIDGLKPGQRKVIFACFKRNLVKDRKVAELSGYIGEQTAYHHGEQSLQQTIIGLAQTFVGSNNVNCLEPSGNFGSRLQGGSDAASPRYIHTRLSAFARRVFSVQDEPILDYQFEETKFIEPKVYAPVIPMVLVNGADGIGTGWSTSIPNYHPMDIVRNLKRRMGRLEGCDGQEQPFLPMTPWFRGWKGTPEPDGPNRFKFNGIAKQDELNPTEVVVTELPIRMWTDDFKSRLEEIIRAEKTPSFIKDYKEFNDHNTVHFVIQMDEKHMKSALEEGLLEKFKLTKSITTTNLVAFNTRGQIHKYENPEEILEEYYHFRMSMYTKRKAHWLKVLHSAFRKLKNQYRFVQEIMDGKLVVSKKKKTALVQELRDRKYDPFPKEENKKINEANDDEETEEVEEDQETASDFDYLLSMPLWSLTFEKLERLQAQIAAKKAEYDELEALSEKDLWCRDLDDFAAEWENQLKLDSEIQTDIRKMGRRVSKKIGAGRGRRAKDDDDYAPNKKTAKSTKAAKPVVKTETKTHQRFAEMFTAKSQPKPSNTPTADGAVDDLSDDDYALLGAATKAAKPTLSSSARDDGGDGRKRTTASKVKSYAVDDDSDFDFENLGKTAASSEKSLEPTPAPVEEVAEEAPRAQNKRAAASKAKTWVIDDDSESDGDNMLGDVGALVKGIGAPAKNSSGGRLSLFAMSRPDAGSDAVNSSTAISKLRTKQSRNFDFDSLDDTNYEALAMSSPRKSTKGDDLDSFLSDDDLPPATKISSGAAARTSSSQAASSKAKAPLSVVPTGAAKKGRGRPAGAKNKPKEEVAKPKPVQLSPAAKAYAAKKAVMSKRRVDSDDEEDDDGDVATSSAPAANTRGRPGRAAAAKAKPIILDDFGDDESDEFAMDDSD
ncbi:hypothetical protein VTK73DRAFT_2338 [Phialemonium thermophilum]|uniref:DNA topoisomerase 2 n=1 Tax=Phialemonium thermophilum TaxID=223376 RepID=A0ABR3X4Z2_9PEZI